MRPHNAAPITPAPMMPSRFGTYAVVVGQGNERAFACTVARVPPRP